MEPKLKQIIILLVVTFLALTAMIVGYGFLRYRPQEEAIAKVQAEYDTRKGVADQLPANLLAQAKAEQEQQLVNGQLAFFRGRYRSMRIDVSRPDQRERTWRRWMNEYFRGYGVAINDEMLEAATDAGVTYDPKPSIVVNAPHPKNPEEIEALLPPNGLIKPVGDFDIGINGDLPSILTYLERITSERSNILKVVSNIRLEGSSPAIKATFRVSPYLILTGPAVKITAGAAAAAAPAAEGAPVEGGAPPP